MNSAIGDFSHSRLSTYHHGISLGILPSTISRIIFGPFFFGLGCFFSIIFAHQRGAIPGIFNSILDFRFNYNLNWWRMSQIKFSRKYSPFIFPGWVSGPFVGFAMGRYRLNIIRYTVISSTSQVLPDRSCTVYFYKFNITNENIPQHH